MRQQCTPTGRMVVRTQETSVGQKVEKWGAGTLPVGCEAGWLPWEAAWRWLKRHSVESPCDPAVLLPGTGPKVGSWGLNTCALEFLTALFTAAKGGAVQVWRMSRQEKRGPLIQCVSFGLQRRTF